ncbi:hypothetical protein GGG16DRAFT_119371 [Schizophyllum commune]
MPPPLPVLDQHITAMEVQSQQPSRQASATRSQVAEAAPARAIRQVDGRPGVGDAPATRSKAAEDALARAGRLLEARRTSCPPRSCFDSHTEGTASASDALTTHSKAAQDAPAHAGRPLEARAHILPAAFLLRQPYRGYSERQRRADDAFQGRQDAPAHAGRLLEARARNLMVIPGTRQALATRSDAFQSRGGYAGEASHADREPAGACRRRAQRS